ncbi:MAG: hypothetical protein DRR08_03175 [Candidatus Parabeggiatoa sp. nov. 2]|nr:MAG: hypothetical protein DRR08_03175 [Gammaproteobacteria bacterium]HEC84287.1 hypothetical protein [Thioploca sp.]
MDYINTDIDGFIEVFANQAAPGASLGLTIDNQTVKSLTLTLGAQADYTMS